MNHDEARTFVRRAVQRVVPDADFTGLDPDASLRDTFDMDSLDFLEFVEALAELSGRELSEDDYPVLVTWNGCADRLVAGVRTTAHGRSG
ncbi:acyl carrier protein [Streptomyces griseus]|uniref:acyl carrier protein n=1 Tax=Streptomyces griseus TaxID=1911 RepID=UPI0004CB7488|nr:phosphopantetheine-binding protein [Streptomyces griseus]